MKEGEANPSISSEILVMIGRGRFRILNGNERIFSKNFEIGFFQGFVPESKTYFSL